MYRKSFIDIVQFTKKITPISAYILGLLWGDGTLYKSSNNTYSLVLEMIADDMKNIVNIFSQTGIWNQNSRHRKGRKPTISLSTHQKDLCIFLSKNDYQNKTGKSANKILKNIPFKYHCYFLRGFLDADGSIRVAKKIKNGKTYLHFSMSFFGCYNQNWYFIEKKLKNLNIQYTISRRKRLCGNSSELNIRKRKDVIKFGKYIYKNNNKIGFQRKFNNYLLAVDYHSSGGNQQTIFVQ